MSIRWDECRVSTSEQIFDKIKHEMARPVGIILFGADCDLKDDVLREFRINLFGSLNKVFHGAPSTHEMVEMLHCSPFSIFVLSSMESSDHQLRHECVKAMRNLGARTVIGVYVKAREPQPLPARGFATRPDLRLMRDTVRTLEQNPPTTDGLDDLLIASKKEEE